MSGLSTRPGVRLDLDALWAMLPMHLRARDEASGGVLRAVLALLADQIGDIEDDLDQLDDDLFIETCGEEAVARIGALIGWRSAGPPGGMVGIAPSRAEVANAIAHRRRKGTAAMLEELGPDVAGWPARIVECFDHLATTQFMNHVRPHNRVFVDLRNMAALERLGTPFEQAARTVELRPVDDAAPRWNVPNLALAVWPMRALRATAAPATRVDNRRWRFSPLRIDEPLYSAAQSESDPTHLADPTNVPAPLRRRAFAAAPDAYYGSKCSVDVTIDGTPVAIADIRVCDLSGEGSWAHLPSANVAIDPVLGRLALPPAMAPADVRVTWHRGLGFAIGGGEYDRLATLDADPPRLETIGAGRTIAAALGALAGSGVAEIVVNDRFSEAPALSAAAGRSTILALRAANGRRPVIDAAGDLSLRGGDGSTIVLDGVLVIGGTLCVPADAANRLRRVVVRDCTLVPGLHRRPNGDADSPDAASIVIERPGVELVIERSIVGAIRLADDAELVLRDSVVDATADNRAAIAAFDGAAAAGAITIAGSTVVGAIHTRLARLVSNSIVFAQAPAGWAAPFVAVRRQQGCVRYSWLPLDSLVPRRHRCVPREPSAGDGDELLRQARPHFASLRFGVPMYAMLANTTPAAIRRGADDGGEMGVGHQTMRPQRLARLRTRLDEFVPVGLRAGIVEIR